LNLVAEKLKQFQKNFNGAMKKFVWWPRVSLLKMRGKKRVALASYPRSGNTWLRLLIEEATGLKSGTIYGGNEIIRRDSEGVVIKTHGWDMYKYTHAIHLLRNPFDVCTSYYHYSKDFYEKKELDWDLFIRKTINEWHKHSVRWMRAANKMPVHRLRYEDLLAKPERELEAIMEWMGFVIPRGTIASAVEATRLEKLQKKHSKKGKNFFRKGKSEQDFSLFSKADQELVFDRVGELMVELDYSTELTNPANSFEHK
jgi:hypothetical protein